MPPAPHDLLRRQHGVVAVRQLRAAGWSRHAVTHAAASGRLHRIHHAVYAWGSERLTVRGQAMAAVLACGTRAAQGAISAAGLWELRLLPGGRWHVISPTGAGSRRAGIHAIRAPDLRREEVTALDGIPITTPARTLLDIAAHVPARHLRRALDQAEILRLFDLAAFDAVVAAHPGHAGRRALRAALDAIGPVAQLTRTDLELAVLTIVDHHGLPQPLVNAPIGEFTVDFLFAQARVVVEADGGPWHTTPQRIEADRERDRVLTIQGYRVLRFTDRQILLDPAGVGRAIAQAVQEARHHASAPALRISRP